jgi:hypothetical protein
MHFDQRWLDLVPTLFEGVGITRDPGANVAYWNLAEREVAIEDGQVRVGRRPGRFFHFSGFDPERPATVTRYSSRPTLAEVGDAAVLFRRYADLVVDAGWPAAKSRPYAYDRFVDGTPIPEVARRLYGELCESAVRFGDPFSTGESSFCSWLGQPVNGARGG